MNKSKKIAETGHFDRRLQHLAAFGGLPHWSFGFNSQASHSRQSVTPARAPSGLGKALGRIYRRYTEWRQLRENIRELGALNDRMLKDIGLHRGDIAAVAAGVKDVEEINAVREILARPACKVIEMPQKSVGRNQENCTHLVDNAA